MTKKKYYFMSGLPRSGSTLLSTLLNQNPEIYSGPSSPVLGVMVGAHENFLTNELYLGYPKPDQANDVIGSMIENFYTDIKKPIIIDKNRAWTGRMSFIEGYIQPEEIKVIVPVRRVDEILTSFLTMVHRNPFKEGQPKINYIDEVLIKSDTPMNDENRCMHLLNAGGILYDSLHTLKLGIEDGYKECFHYVDYNDMMDDPQGEMDKIYEFLGEKSFEHTFEGLANQNREKDLEVYGLADMHEVHSVLKKTSPPPSTILPESILEIYEQNRLQLEFWTEPLVPKIQPKKYGPPETKAISYNLFSNK